MVSLRRPLRPLSPGTLFAGRFRIRNVLGVGSSGPVYRVLDEVAGEERALKFLTLRSRGTPEIPSEVSVLSSLNHPSLVSLRDFITTPRPSARWI
jgi:serine/threonine protein kinase